MGIHKVGADGENRTHVSTLATLRNTIIPRPRRVRGDFVEPYGEYATPGLINLERMRGIEPPSGPHNRASDPTKGEPA